MKKMKQILALAVTACLLLCGCSKQKAPEPVESKGVSLQQAQEAYLKKVDVDYSYALATKLSEIRSNEALGYRTAGSKAELATGDLLKKEMEEIGLSDVTKDAFTLDTWNFEKAKLTYSTAAGEKKSVELGGYQTDFITDGPKEYQVVYAGQGTQADLNGLDVAGKLVLIDINQRDNWWINYPAYEAHLAGAAAVLAAQDGGYAEISPDALNAQDICGPANAPAFSISRTDADLLRAALESSGGQATVTLDADSRVGFDGTSYNIVGKITGKDPDSMVLMSAHYDSYFEGFQDDNAAIALMMGIAKGLVQSGYQPEKTLVFCAMAAEEWGISDTRYDWSIGAYNQIFRVHPDWVGKVVADINFELPAMNEGDTDQIRSSYELKSFTEAFAPKVPAIDGIFAKGIEVITPIQTWSDDFSLSIAGVPSCVTALRGGFAQTHYHSQYDNAETYSEPAFRYHHNLYGMLMLEYDRCAVSPLDFSTRAQALRESIDREVMTAAGVDVSALDASLDTLEKTAASAYETVKKANADYGAALEAGDREKAASLLEKSRSVNAQALEAFLFAETQFVRLTWEDVSIFPHEHAQGNYAAINASLDALKQGDGAGALDNSLYLVDNNWYAYDWSRETYDHFTNYVLDQPADRLMWGAGRVQGHEDLYEVIRSVKTKSALPSADYGEEIKTLETALANQQKLLAQQVAHEVSALDQLNSMLKAF